ncbi:MAG: 1,3-beta-galactosyl-N-acetylhexosamine phosphorylase [Clostridia bacterium]|nr:1,3-beta-galactosyl-N-acetylhexosamine phosphorylase [Clostridia bacterium]
MTQAYPRGRAERIDKGGFTLPGEAGYEALTLELAEKWGADVIRDSDGTKLSPGIVAAGYRIYSTICIIREHNAFAEAHPDAQQQTFLISDAVLAEEDRVTIEPLAGYFDQQFQLNDSPEALEYWQVWDRTAGRLVPRDRWRYADGKITVDGCTPWHRYTASFLCWRIWEEINMYNHTTNHWTSAHLRQLDPRHPLAWAYLQKWLEDWCEANPRTDVVRLTSLFYNFVWIFGADLRRRSRFVDWASYDFTVSPAALKAFEAEYGYALSAEDFINGGRLQATHRPPTAHKRDYMDFIQRFVAEKAKVLVDIIHRHSKQAYVFYDDSWVGMEPYGKYFSSIGFDGLIKCVFSGFECRLCAGADVPVHELRFHPYLFPVGLGGLPTFSEGGHPERDAMAYWLHVRRALARQPVQRIGLGGYLHLTKGFPEFVEAIGLMARQFRRLKALHEQGAPAVLPVRVAVLHTWGHLRAWTLSGHFHETDANPLIHINEALSGLPVDVRFIDFEQARSGGLDGVDVVINAGFAGDAWSGGDAWRDPVLVAELTRFVHEGGAFIGVGEPSACPGGDTCLKLAHVLGVDVDDGSYACHAPWAFEVEKAPPFEVCPQALGCVKHARLIAPDAKVLAEADGAPQMTLRRFGRGWAAWLSGFAYSPASARMLLELLLFMTGTQAGAAGICSHPLVETAWFPASGTLVLMNNGDKAVQVEALWPEGRIAVSLEAWEMKFITV